MQVTVFSVKYLTQLSYSAIFAKTTSVSNLAEKLTAGDVIGERGFFYSGSLFHQATVLVVLFLLTSDCLICTIFGATVLHVQCMRLSYICRI